MLTKKQILLDQERTDQAWVAYTDWKAYEHGMVTVEVGFDEAIFAEFGYPDQITVTIEPGYAFRFDIEEEAT